jgi:hypothetical protein
MASAALGTGIAADAQEPTTEEQRDAVRDQAAEVAEEIDVLEAENAEIEAALAAVQTEVVGQRVVVTQTSDALANAEAAVAESKAQIEDLEQRSKKLEAEVEQIIVESYINPPIDHALDAFEADTLTQAAVKTGLVEIQSAADTAKLEQLDETTEQLEDERETNEELADEALLRKDEADAAMTELDASLGTQTALAEEVETALDAKKAKADELAASDVELSRQLDAERAALASALADATAAPPASGIQPAPGGLATVSCPAGGSITVAGSIASSLQSLLDASYADGVMLCGGGYRDPQQQIELRKAHCGTSYYAIYEMPSSQCSPPTAQPGSSMHEQGLAVDFTCDGGGSVSSGSSCFAWLSANAASYGLYNLPSEPWHWSTNGN